MKSFGRSARVLWAMTAVVVVTALLPAGPARAALQSGATFDVDRLNDGIDTAPGDGHCDSIGTTADGDQCTLRAAVQESNADPDANVVQLRANSVYHLTIDGAHEEHADSGDLDVRSPVAFVGAGSSSTIVDGGNRSSLSGTGCDADGMNDRMFHVKLSSAVTMTGFTIMGARTAPGEDGGALRNDSSNMTLSNMVIGSAGLPVGCYANRAANGGGVFTGGGALAVTDSHFTHNLALGAGGAMMLEGSGSTTISSSTFGDASAAPGQPQQDDGAGDNHAHCAGGAIANGVPAQGSRLLVDQGTLIAGNAASDSGNPGACSRGGIGGGIFNAGPARLSGVVVSGNAAHTGGGIYNGGESQPAAVDLDVDASAIVGNTAADGAGIANAGDAETDVVTSTISANSASARGGGLYAHDLAGDGGRVRIANATIARNSAGHASGGDGIHRAGPLTTVALAGSIVAARSDGSGDGCIGGVASEGFNLDDDGSCALSQASDLSGAEPGLTGLHLDPAGGGPVHGLIPASPALDAGPPACPPTDQRGATRPQDGDLDGTARCDIGAYERVPRDVDGDRVDDEVDACPASSGPHSNGGCPATTPGGGQGARDGDGDSVVDPSDNCPAVANPQQNDLDGDGAGDVCDADDDGDGATDAADNCPRAANADQSDIDGDGAGDACDDPVEIEPVILLSYDKAASAFTGQVATSSAQGSRRATSSPDSHPCLTDIAVTIKKARRGPDAAIGTVAIDGAYRFLLYRNGARGRFYATTPLVAAGSSVCASARSRTIVVRARALDRSVETAVDVDRHMPRGRARRDGRVRNIDGLPSHCSRWHEVDLRAHAQPIEAADADSPYEDVSFVVSDQ